MYPLNLVRMLVFVPTCVHNTHSEFKLDCSTFTVWILDAALIGAYVCVNWMLYSWFISADGTSKSDCTVSALF